MQSDRQAILSALRNVLLPDGGDLISRDLVRALSVEDGSVRFVIEAQNAELAQKLVPVREAAEKMVSRLEGVKSVQAVLTSPSSQKAPSLKIGRHPEPGNTSIKPENIKSLIAVGSGKGGVGKSTVSANLAVALAKEGKRVGLLDADIYGPSIPQMMGVSERAEGVGGKEILPAQAHGVVMMSIGMMVEEGRAVIWRGPMLMGALQQMLGQVRWGDLDVLIVDLPPGTGDVQLTLCQRAEVTGAILVSTPQDVALIDARRAISMFETLKTPILGLIENMSFYVCPNCGDEAHIFGSGGVQKEAEALGVPLLGSLPIDLATRQGGDSGVPIASGEGLVAEAYRTLARRFIEGGIV